MECCFKLDLFIELERVKLCESSWARNEAEPSDDAASTVIAKENEKGNAERMCERVWCRCQRHPKVTSDFDAMTCDVTWHLIKATVVQKKAII